MWNFVPVEFGVSTIICLVSIIQVAALSVLFYFAFPHKQRWMTDSICFSWNEIFFEFPRCWMSNSSCIFSEKESKEEWVSETLTLALAQTHYTSCRCFKQHYLLYVTESEAISFCCGGIMLPFVIAVLFILMGRRHPERCPSQTSFFYDWLKLPQFKV